MNSLEQIIVSRVTEYCVDQKDCSADHIINFSQVVENIVFMKSNKHDGNVGHYSDQIIQGTKGCKCICPISLQTCITWISATRHMHIYVSTNTEKSKEIRRGFK